MMARCGAGKCWYEGQGFVSCYAQRDAECVRRYEGREARQSWRCPDCGRETTVGLSTGRAWCMHGSDMIAMDPIEAEDDG